MTLVEIILFLLLNISQLTLGFTIPEIINPQFERIVTNFDEVVNGVPVDFRYNESNSFEGLTSVPGCPKSEVGIPWVYYGSPPSCYLSGQQGPCDLDEKLFLEYENPYGICNCKCFQDDTWFDFDKVQFCEQPGVKIPGGNLELVYYPISRKCFKLHDQGPCKLGEWLTKTSDNTNVRCEQRKCPEGQYPQTVSVAEIFDANKNCQHASTTYGLSRGITPAQCPHGSKYSELLRTCVKKPTGYTGSPGK